MLAVLHVEDGRRPDREAEAEAVFSTTNREHPGVAQLLNRTEAGVRGQPVLQRRMNAAGRRRSQNSASLPTLLIRSVRACGLTPYLSANIRPQCPARKSPEHCRSSRGRAIRSPPPAAAAGRRARRVVNRCGFLLAEMEHVRERRTWQVRPEACGPEAGLEAWAAGLRRLRAEQCGTDHGLGPGGVRLRGARPARALRLRPDAVDGRGLGVIGAAVAAELLAAGHRVLGVDDLNGAYDVRLKEWRLERLRVHGRFTFRRADVSDRAALRAACDVEPPLDGVINLAAHSGIRASVDDPWACFDANVTGTLNLLDLCRDRGVRKFVLASTASLYDARGAMPHREDADTSRVSNPYAASKPAAEALCHSYHHVFGLDVTVFRYLTVYGPAGRPDMSLFRFVQWVHEERPVLLCGDGTQSRDFTYVNDVATGHRRGARAPGLRGCQPGRGRPDAAPRGPALRRGLRRPAPAWSIGPATRRTRRRAGPTSPGRSGCWAGGRAPPGGRA